MNLQSFASVINSTLFLLLVANISGTALASNIRVSSECMETEGTKKNKDDDNEFIKISFTNDNPKSNDWVGLFPSSAIQDSKQVPEPKDHRWIRTCGDQKCNSSPSKGNIQIRRPRNEGKWVIVLAREGNSAPYRLIAKTSFRIDTNCDSFKPAPKPKSKPSRSPTKPKPKGNSLKADKTSYAFNTKNGIDIRFTVADPKSGDWIGIFNANKPLDSQEQPHFWLWAGCDRQGSLNEDCSKKSSGTVTFKDDKAISFKSKWPLSPGSYVAAMMRRGDDHNPWRELAVSAPFEIRPPPFGQTNVRLVREDIKRIIKDDIKWAAKFLRLAFHDSVDGPDGCVDLTDIHNRGLEEVIDILDPVVTRHEGNLTRGDIWSIAALVGAQVSQPDDSNLILDFDFFDYGRVNCENIHRICQNKDGVSHGCSAKRGPFRDIPGVHTTSHDLYAFFKDQFDFDTDETVAIMGAHTLGQLARKNSGIDGKHGWVLGNTKLDNEYYFELIGGKDVNDRVETLVNNAPKWQRFLERNPKTSEFGNVPIWHGLPEGNNGRAIVMLNIDMALVRDLDDDNLNSKDGRVSCKFVERDDSKGPVCPHLKGSIRQAARYKHDNELWQRDFQRVLRKMMKAGYEDKNNNCIDGLCLLSRKVT